MPEYKKVGYLTTDFKMFHLKDEEMRTFHYHYHDFHKILILLNGDVTYCIEGRSEEKSHVLRVHSFGNSRLGAVTKDLDASLSDSDFAHELHHKLLFLEFLIQLNRAAGHNKIEFIETSASSEKILSILNYLNEHLTESISIDDLSSRFYLSRYYLMHTFKEQTGYSIGSYLSTKRLLLAKELILSGKPITDVCYECGFKNYSTFSRAYKKCFGESPRDLRQSTFNH